VLTSGILGRVAQATFPNTAHATPLSFAAADCMQWKSDMFSAGLP
jgi:hypothetical protein